MVPVSRKVHRWVCLPFCTLSNYLHMFCLPFGVCLPFCIGAKTIERWCVYLPLSCTPLLAGLETWAFAVLRLACVSLTFFCASIMVLFSSEILAWVWLRFSENYARI